MMKDIFYHICFPKRACLYHELLIIRLWMCQYGFCGNFMHFNWMLGWCSQQSNVILWYRGAALKVHDIHDKCKKTFHHVNGQLQSVFGIYCPRHNNSKKCKIWRQRRSRRKEGKDQRLSPQKSSTLFLISRPIHAQVPNAWCCHFPCNVSNVSICL